MAISQQTLQNVEFLELRRVFKRETDDIVKVDEKILDVLKDNNAILKDLIDKIQLTAITKGLGKSKKYSKDKDDEEFVKSFGSITDFFTGFGKRIEEYKEFFFGKKIKSSVKGKTNITALEKEIEPKNLALEEKAPIPKFVGRGEMQQVYSNVPVSKTPALQSKTPMLENKGPIANYVGKGERKQLFPESPLLNAPEVNSSKPLVLEAPKIELKTPLLEAPKKKYDDVIDVTPVQSKTPILEAPKSIAPLMLEGPKQKTNPTPSILDTSKKIEQPSSSGTISTKLVEDIASIKKAMLNDGILVKVINPEELKSQSGGEGGGGVGALDVAKSGLDAIGDIAGNGKAPDKAGGKVSKFLGMAGKAAKVLGPAAAIAGAAYSGFEGFQNTEQNFDLKEGEKATTGQKISSTLGGIASGATFGLLSEKTAAQGIQKAGNAIGSFFGIGKKDETPTPGKIEEKGIRIAGEAYIEGQPLSEKQMAVIGMAKDMGKQYPPAIEAQYSKQKQELVNKITPAEKKDIATPMSEMSRDNEDLKRQSSAPTLAPPIVSNTVQTNNTQTLSPIKAQPRGTMSSALERYVDRVSAFA